MNLSQALSAITVVSVTLSGTGHVVHAAHDSKAALLAVLRDEKAKDKTLSQDDVLKAIKPTSYGAQLSQLDNGYHHRHLQIVPAFEAKLGASDAAFEDQFGIAVAISGDTVVAGDTRSDDGGKGAGAAYVHTGSAGEWTQEVKLLANDAGERHHFGRAVAISGDTIVVGAHGHNAVYVFVRSDDTWTQQVRFKADNGVRFGFAVAISGDTIVAGAYLEDNDGHTNSGSAYVYHRSGGNWTQQAKLTEDNAAAGDHFGGSVAISGDTIVVGANRHNANGLSDNGAVYVFVESDESWTQQAKLTVDGVAKSDWFGISVAVAISGDTVVVGAYGNDNSGSAYVYHRSSGNWAQQAKLIAHDAAASDQFGCSVAISGDRVLVGSRFDDDAGNNSGSVYFYTRSDGNWTGEAKYVQDDAAANDQFGFAVAISGDKAVVGSINNNYNSVADAGAAYILALSPGPWKVGFQEMIANFTTTSINEIQVKYHVGRGRTAKTFLYQKGCKDKTPIGDIAIVSNNSTEPFNSTFNTLTVSHSIDKSKIANSTDIWNSTSSMLEVCQVVELREGNMVVVTNEHELTINFNLTVDYDTGNVALEQVDTLEDSTDTNLDDYIDAFKCDGDQFDASTTAHLENTQLNICIKSESTDVVIDKIQTMTITQVVNGADPDKSWTIVDDDVPVYLSLTSKTPVAGKGVFVSTFVPASTFSYTGNPITVSGTVELLLANSRRLTVNIDSMVGATGEERGLQVGGIEQAASFGVDVLLEPQPLHVDVAILNSAKSSNSNSMHVFAAFVFVLVFSMW